MGGYMITGILIKSSKKYLTRAPVYYLSNTVPSGNTHISVTVRESPLSLKLNPTSLPALKAYLDENSVEVVCINTFIDRV